MAENQPRNAGSSDRGRASMGADKQGEAVVRDGRSMPGEQRSCSEGEASGPGADREGSESRHTDPKSGHDQTKIVAAGDAGNSGGSAGNCAQDSERASHARPEAGRH